MYGKSILILAPHPDDEIVGCATAVSQARGAGSSVSVLYLTTGVPGPTALWPWARAGHPERVLRRRAEAQRTADRMDVRVIDFLETSARELRHCFGETRDRVLHAIDAIDADTLWVPAFEGGHQDHDAANAIAATLADVIDVWEFAEYNLAGRKVLSQSFPESTDTETLLTLSDEEWRLKMQLLAAYESEAANLRHIGVEQECFRPLVSYDYGRPPHPGRLFFARFAWVPFRHPRVDFSDPAAVYADLDRCVAAWSARPAA